MYYTGDLTVSGIIRYNCKIICRIIKFRGEKQTFSILEVFFLQPVLDGGTAVDIRSLPVRRYNYYPAIYGDIPEACTRYAL